MSIFSNPAGQAADAAAAYTTALLELLGDRDPLQVQRGLVAAVRELVTGLGEADVRREEAPGKWSILQVIGHLADQELVNGWRIRSIVAEDQPPLRGYDQDRWAARLRYDAAPTRLAIEELDVLRRRNLRLFDALTDEEWERTGLHSERGPESVRRICRLTAAHDLLHRRQIERIRAALGKPGPGFSVRRH
jgi:hypothetical protein